jgi:uncharacterized protein with PIN domain
MGRVMETRFIADAMLGKLARWMRVLGCDVAYFPAIGDRELVELAESSGRLILTRDTLLVKRRRARDNHFFVEGDDFRSQLRQVVERFAIDPNAHFLTRCLACNALLAEIGKGAVRSWYLLIFMRLRKSSVSAPSAAESTGRGPTGRGWQRRLRNC